MEGRLPPLLLSPVNFEALYTHTWNSCRNNRPTDRRPIHSGPRVEAEARPLRRLHDKVPYSPARRITLSLTGTVDRHLGQCVSANKHRHDFQAAMNPEQDNPILVVGAGSWGTALAVLLASNGTRTLLWGRDPEKLREYLPRRATRPTFRASASPARLRSDRTSRMRAKSGPGLAVFVVRVPLSRERCALFSRHSEGNTRA